MTRFAHAVKQAIHQAFRTFGCDIAQVKNLNVALKPTSGNAATCFGKQLRNCEKSTETAPGPPIELSPQLRTARQLTGSARPRETCVPGWAGLALTDAGGRPLAEHRHVGS